MAGGELLIPTIVLLFGLDIKLAGSLSLAVSLPTMIIGFFRYSKSSSFSVLKEEMSLFKWMSIGSIIGAAIGGLLLGVHCTYRINKPALQACAQNYHRDDISFTTM